MDCRDDGGEALRMEVEVGWSGMSFFELCIRGGGSGQTGLVGRAVEGDTFSNTESGSDMDQLRDS